MTKIFNKASEKGKRKQLRSNMPPAEVILWSKIRAKQLNGYKFHRQYSVDQYILDFTAQRLNSPSRSMVTHISI